MLLKSESVCSSGGKLGGKGVDKLFPSRCSSTKEVKAANDAGMTPARDVSDRSLEDNYIVSSIINL